MGDERGSILKRSFSAFFIGDEAESAKGWFDPLLVRGRGVGWIPFSVAICSLYQLLLLDSLATAVANPGTSR